MIVYNNIESGMTEVYLGNVSIAQVYIGNNKVFPSDVPPTPTAAKFQASYIGGTSYSAACDSSTELTIGTVRPSGYEYSAMTNAEVGQCITSIAGYAFGSCTAMTSCTIPNSVTSIGNYAFSLCYSLASIDIPNSITSIGSYAFNTCSGLTSINIPSGVTSIGEGTFEYCISMASCTIPNSVTSIGDFAFKHCSGLTSVTIPDSVTSIGYSAFTNCSSLQSITCNAVTPPTLWGSYAFVSTNNCPIYVPCQSVEAYKTAWSAYASRIQCVEPSFDGKLKLEYSGGTSYSADCDSSYILRKSETRPSGYETYYVVSAQIGDCVTYLDSDVFYNNFPNLQSVTLPSGLTRIDSSAFSYCGNLSSINIPSGVTYIGGRAFYECNNLQNITLPNDVTIIGMSFYGCDSFTDLYIPSGVTIGSNTFNGCSSLTSITVDNNNATYDSRNNCNAIIETATNKLIQGCNTTVIPNSVSSISDGAFLGCISLTSVDIPSGVTTIENDVFRSCSSLTSVTIPSGVTSIGNDAFNGCNSITSITIPSAVTTIGSGTFYNCRSLQSIDIPSGVTSLEIGVFSYCTSLTSINIPSGVTNIDVYAFRGCRSLTSITVNATTPPTLGEDAFNYTNSCPIYVPSGSVNAYQSAWSEYASRIQPIPNS